MTFQLAPNQIRDVLKETNNELRYAATPRAGLKDSAFAAASRQAFPLPAEFHTQSDRHRDRPARSSSIHYSVVRHQLRIKVRFGMHSLLLFCSAKNDYSEFSAET